MNYDDDYGKRLYLMCGFGVFGGSEGVSWSEFDLVCLLPSPTSYHAYQSAQSSITKSEKELLYSFFKLDLFYTSLGANIHSIHHVQCLAYVFWGTAFIFIGYFSSFFRSSFTSCRECWVLALTVRFCLRLFKASITTSWIGKG
jgi:hypothetical protein